MRIRYIMEFEVLDDDQEPLDLEAEALKELENHLDGQLGEAVVTVREISSITIVTEATKLEVIKG